MRALLILLLAITVSFPVVAEARDRDTRSQRVLRGPATGEPKALRTGELNFEGEVVEGLNKNPLDSIQSVGDQIFRSGERLFKKKEHFRREMDRMLGDMEYSP